MEPCQIFCFGPVRLWWQVDFGDYVITVRDTSSNQQALFEEQKIIKQHWNLFYFGRQRWSNVLMNKLYLFSIWGECWAGVAVSCCDQVGQGTKMVAFRIIPGIRVRGWLQWKSSLFSPVNFPMSTATSTPDCYEGRLIPHNGACCVSTILKIKLLTACYNSMVIMFQCFIDFPMCVIISQCLLTFHNFTGLADPPANNYDRVVF